MKVADLSRLTGINQHGLAKLYYENAKEILIQNEIQIEKELTWGNEKLKSIYFRDPSRNLVEFITKGNWPVED